jgi:two-component system CheB/CheR fusion protein
MGPTAQSLLTRYGMAVLAIVAALLVRLLVDPLVGDGLPMLFFYLAVVVVAWHGGFGPCLVAVFLGLLAAAYCFLQPRHDLAASLAGHRVLAIGFLVLGVTIGVFSEALRAARRRAEAHADEANRRRQELEEEVAERKQLEQELQRRAEQLAEADRRKDEFLAMLAHELRNPLAPVLNSLYIMKQFADDAGMIGRARDMAERQVQHMARLLDDLLDVSRITRGKIMLRKETVELAVVIARAIETSQPLIDARNHRLAVTLPRETLWLEVDVTRLAQVFSNLLNNAAKYTPNGGHIGLTVEASAGSAVVRVQDDGQGIAADLLPHVFDLFTQADGSLARSEGGLGIGLTLVKSLVERHGGCVAARSAGPGQGSEFVVRLPVLAQVPATPAEPGPGEPSPRRLSTNRRILVVEDNADAADSLAVLLRVCGHDVRTVHDGAAALEAAEAFRPEVVLLDIGLPRMDGYQVARRLREQSGTKTALLVAVTGYGQEEDRRRAAAAGFDAYMTKPADPIGLERLLAGSAANP